MRTWIKILCFIVLGLIASYAGFKTAKIDIDCPGRSTMLVDPCFAAPAPTTRDTFGLDAGDASWGIDPHWYDANLFYCGFDGDLDTLEILCMDEVGQGNVKMGIHNSSEGLLDTCYEVAFNTGWTKAALVTVVPVINGSWYFLTFRVSNMSDIKYQTGGPASSHKYMDGTISYTDQWLSSLPSGSYNTNRFVMRAHGTVSEEEAGQVIIVH